MWGVGSPPGRTNRAQRLRGIVGRGRRGAGPPHFLYPEPNTLRKVDLRLPGNGTSSSHGARPVHKIISMIHVSLSRPGRRSRGQRLRGIVGRGRRGAGLPNPHPPHPNPSTIYPGPVKSSRMKNVSCLGLRIYG